MDGPSRTPPRDRKSLPALAVGRERFRAFNELVPIQGDIDQYVVKSLMEITGLSKSHVRRLAARFQQNRTPEVLAPSFSGPKPGSRMLTSEIQAALSRHIAELYLKKGIRPTKARAARSIRLLLLAEAEAASWDPEQVPSERTIVREIAAIPASVLAKVAPPSRKTEFEYSDPGRSSSGPLDVVQMDHTRGNVFLVDSIDRWPIGRPWVTFLICVFTRCIVGYLVSMQAPSILRCGRAIVNAILPKEPLMAELGLGHLSYPIHGVFNQFDHDGETAHKNVRLLAACRMAGIGDPNARPFKGPPTYGAHIERLIGTMLGDFRFLDGATGNDPTERIDYDPATDATMSLAEFERWLVLQIISYHHQLHRSLNKAPLQAWRDGGGEQVPTYAGDVQDLFKRFLPAQLRKVQTRGVQFARGFYRHAALADLQGMTFYAHCDPYNMNELHLDTEDGFLTLIRQEVLPRAYELEHDAWLLRRKEHNEEFHHAEGLPTMVATAVESRRQIEESRRITRERRKAGEGLSRMDELKPTLLPAPIATSSLEIPDLDSIPIWDFLK